MNTVTNLTISTSTDSSPANLTINTGDNSIIIINGESYPSIQLSKDNYSDRKNPCDNCINNPANNPFASGFCNCALPYMYNVTY